MPFGQYTTSSDASVDNPQLVSFPFGARDAFGRLRVTNPLTLFDSKQLYSSQPLYWDDQEVSGSGTSSVHSQDRASTTMQVTNLTAGKRVRQTFQRFNYQPGKSQLILMTGVLSAGGGASGIHSAMGYFDDKNGIFVSTNDTVSFNIRSHTSGTPVDTSVSQSSWNGDKLDGTGPSGITLDVTKAQIFWTDMEWLGVGSVRVGFVIDGAFILCHTFNHANTIDSVYMSSANLPCRYEIENDGTGPTASLEHICSTVISEGGLQAQGQLHLISTSNLGISASQNTLTAVLGISLQATQQSQQVDLTSVSMLNSTKDAFEWSLLINPTVAGTFTYTNHPDSSSMTAIGSAANTVTGGNVITGGLVSGATQGNSFSSDLQNALRLGASIAGVSDRIVLCVLPYKTNSSIDATLGWRELT